MTKLFDDELPPVIVDRSSLERSATCPFQSQSVRRKIVTSVGELATVGTEVHNIISEAIRSRCENGTRMNDLRDLIETKAAQSRPDVQPLVIEACRRTYSIAELICRHQSTGEERDPSDILRFDGGLGKQSGQLATDILPATDERGPIRLTGELDLLMATASAKELDLIDWKSGWKWYTATDTKASFQFQSYAYLVLANYPTVDRVNVTVFMPRYGESTSPVTFERKDMFSIGERIKSAIAIHQEYRDTPMDEVPAWPEPSKCLICSAVLSCPKASSPEASINIDPEAAIKHLVVLYAAAKKIETSLSVIVRQGIEDVRPAGDLVYGNMAYGTEKPKQKRATPCSLYTLNGKEE